MPRRPGNRSRHAPLRPLSMVECHLCHGIGHYANDPNCPKRSMIPPSQMINGSSLPPQMVNGPPFPSSSINPVSLQTIHPAQIKFTENLSLVDILQMIMNENTKLKQEIFDVNKHLADVLAMVSQASSSNTSSAAPSSSSSSSSNTSPLNLNNINNQLNQLKMNNNDLSNIINYAMKK
jgi:hypothetical protein